MKKKILEKKILHLWPLRWFEVGIEGGEKFYILANFVETNDQLDLWIHYCDEDKNTIMASFKEWRYFIKINDPDFSPGSITKEAILPSNWGKLD